MKCILFVHDHQENPWQRRQLLESAGVHVDLAKSSHECLKYLDKTRPDLVLMDILVEGANGFELCEEIRKRHTKQELPILLCSGIYRRQEFAEEAKRVGANKYLISPTELNELISEISILTCPADEREPALV